MARPSRPRVLDSSDEDDDSFPDIRTLARQETKPTSREKTKPPEKGVSGANIDAVEKAPGTVRKRRLGQKPDTALLRGWTANVGTGRDGVQPRGEEDEGRPRRPRVALRSRAIWMTDRPKVAGEDSDEPRISAQEVTITEEVSLVGDLSGGGESESSDSDSDFEDSLADFIVDDDEDLSTAESETRSTPNPTSPLKERKPTKSTAKPVPNNRKDAAVDGHSNRDSTTKRSPLQSQELPRRGTSRPKRSGEKDLADAFSGLKLNDLPVLVNPAFTKDSDEPRTPPPTPPKTKPSLVSPEKLRRIPNTPHRPSSDMFWSQDFVDDWNDEHSPRKKLFPDPSKASPVKKPAGEPKMRAVLAREAKKAFGQGKHDMAAAFLRELDTVITKGELSKLAASTGGIKLQWSNKLNTTAGRANWKRETVRTTAPSLPGDRQGAVSIVHHHHASIELAEKVIDDEHRLLNVVAHEFCHLANFMVSGITKNPHGKEFKAWAAKCSRAFAHRGIEVTTKHSYDIDFKYVWECSGCALAYKRHSKSVDPARHRCGRCRGELKQVKPRPRGAGAANKEGTAKKGPSEYQMFMKEEMKKVKQENPSSPQKDIMRLVASKWTERQGGRSTTSTPTPSLE